MRWIPILVCSALLAGSAGSAAAQTAPARAAAPGNANSKPTAKEAVTTLMLPPSPRALLPDALDGWVETEPPKSLADPAQADPANAAALKEYDYTGGASVTYKREGETLSVRALRFQDASGAYGAYYLLPPEWMDQGGHRRRRDLRPQPGAFLEGRHGGGCNLFAHRAHVRR